MALVAALAPVTNAFLDMKKMTFEPFEAMRPKINFPSYTPEQRQTVADQADAILSVSGVRDTLYLSPIFLNPLNLPLLLQIYVNRESKISNYGVDPIPTMKDIKKRAKKMSDSEFHLAMASLFLSLRDFHTNYQLPSPYNCYRALYPLSFELVDSRDILNEPVVAVKVKRLE